MERHNWLIGAAAVVVSLALAPAERRQYRFAVEYFNFTSKGEFLQKTRIVGDYSAGEPGDDVRWARVTVASGTSLTGAYEAGEPQPYMEGFTYAPARERMFAPEFFKSFPPMATQAKNLVWDMFMLETFAHELSHVKAAAPSPYHVPSWAVPLAGTGVFTNTDIQLTWMGIVERNKQECVLVRYEAFFNTVEHELPGIRLVGRSDYWGDIWVSLSTGDIDSATLYEEVVGELRLAAQSAPQAISVVRKGTLERIPSR
jgi:hypothetical protein